MKAVLATFALLLSLGATARDGDLQLVGEARLKFLFWSVYNSRLYSDDGRYLEGQRPLRLEIEYRLDIDADDLVAQTASEWQYQGLAHQQQQRWLQMLTDLWPDVSKGDVLTLTIDGQQRSTFYRNGERLGTIADPGFGQQFLDIWLSPNTSRPELRLALTGQQ